MGCITKPDQDLRYFSKRIAFSLSSKQQYQISLKGRFVEVYATEPLLCFFKRDSTLVVNPV